MLQKQKKSHSQKRHRFEGPQKMQPKNAKFDKAHFKTARKRIKTSLSDFLSFSMVILAKRQCKKYSLLCPL